MQKILAKLTTNECQRMTQGMAKLDEAIKVLEDADIIAKKLTKEADGIKERWTKEMREKYYIFGDDITFDPESGTIRELSSENATIVKIIEMLAGLRCE